MLCYAEKEGITREQTELPKIYCLILTTQRGNDRVAAFKQKRSKVFISYSHKDIAALERLQVHLKPLESEGIVDRWDDSRIKTGQRWREAIREAIKSAKVAVLLVSPDFLASDFIVSNELPPLLAAAEKEGLVIMPVILSYSRFQRIPALSAFQALNSPEEPLESLSKVEQDALWVRLTEEIESIVHPQ